MALHADNPSERDDDEAPAPATGRGADDARALRSFLKIETRRLRTRHRFGLGGLEVARLRSDLVDHAIRRACRTAAALFDPLLRPGLGVSGCAVLALGGYGRRELAPASDVDLLFLHQGRSAGVRAFVQHVLHLLWDAGLTVGHSFRSVAECVDLAQRDTTCRTAMTEARLVSGSTALFAQLVRGLESNVAAGPALHAAYLEDLRRQLRERHARFEGTVCLQEPNVKEGPGGLRDLHAALWWGRARFGDSGLEAMRDAARVSPSDFATVRGAHDFLLRVRNEAHFATGRRADLLSLDLQPALARGLGYTSRRGLEGSEILMREYYRRAEALHRFCRAFLLQESPPAPGAPRGRARAPFAVGGGELWPAAADHHARQGPRRALEAFALAQEKDLRLSDALKAAIRGGLHRFDARFRRSRAASRAMTRLLAHPGRIASSVRALHDTGVLGRLFPEFAGVTFLVQHDHYHCYTVDEHTLRALEALDDVASGSERADAVFHELFREVGDPARLYLALLLHDVGKGRPGPHAARGAILAERACRRLGLGRGAVEDVVFLVRNHLLMSHLAQRRDLTEPATADGLLAEARTLDRLNMLLLLTYADQRAVAPGVWNDWTHALLWDLYSRARARLAGPARGSGGGRIRTPRERALAQLAPDFRRSDVDRHFAVMPPRYLRTAAAEDMARHFRLLHALGEAQLRVEWRHLADRRCTELAVATRDAHGLVALLAGVLTASGLDILSLDACTREDGLVLDVFRLREVQGGAPTRPARWAALEQRLRAALEGRFDVAAAMDAFRARAARRRPRAVRARPSARFDPAASGTCSVLEVRAEDRPGLVHALASTLSGLGLEIAFATVATENGQALDVFYVTDQEGRKLDAAGERAAEQGVLRALGAPRARPEEA